MQPFTYSSILIRQSPLAFFIHYSRILPLQVPVMPTWQVVFTLDAAHPVFAFFSDTFLCLGKSRSSRLCPVPLLNWISYLLQDLHIPVRLPLTLIRDNKSAQLLAANPCYHDNQSNSQLIITLLVIKFRMDFFA